MDNKYLLGMAERLTLATASRDWTAIAALDAELAAVLERLAHPEAWTSTQRRAVNYLRQAHREALRCCQQEMVLLDTRLTDMRANRDGWLAYAMNEEWQENTQ